MKLQLRFAPPPPGSRTRLPFLLVPVLAGVAALQLAWPARIDLPPVGPVARVGAVVLPDAPPDVVAPPVLASRDLFAPPIRRRAPDSAGDPLAGAVIAGVVQRGRLRLGIVQQPGGQVRYVGVGGDIAGWRLAALDQARARLTHGPGQDLLVAYGMHPAPPKNADATATGSAPAAEYAPQVANFGFPQTIERGQ